MSGRVWLLVLCCLFSGSAAMARELPYDDNADAPAQVAAAIQAGVREHRPVLLIFGANWCPDCRVLAKVLASAPLAERLASSVELVKVDVGNFDHNMELAMSVGNPIAGGIPAAVLIGPDRQVLASTKPGELADARKMSGDGIVALFDRLLAAPRAH